MYWNTTINPLSSPMRVVVLVALRDIEPEEELYSTYMDITKAIDLSIWMKKIFFMMSMKE
ncbi:hypothetical protein RO3G_15809 [Rhizopus delemar RA 99-880]|uniref:SET domain-containing protein n=1 Tax=Rhizopus delemar (strain RA 99-880 / ATCC MYA-4621 / FGSC 9543 / NRRL 43880) TaxID=246409 RepID=I1CRL8_RHIO9|nr:hypothetical protein RO3G_15809 [Rhizopus delemar RA 99-880]|eukprot:EIE91098.1 hypothetical protein RO3G_15809 [Rhizopus delemar RA 99-880]